MVWMKDTEPQITIRNLPNRDKWVIFNIQQTGYYRVNYDINNWKLIIDQLKTNHEVINIMNRAQIIDDALDLARAGQLSYNIALSVNSYLNRETEYVPWVAALNNLDYIENMFSRAAGYGALKKYLLHLVVPLYKAVGFADNLNDPHLDQKKRVRALSWACMLGYEDCVNKSVALFKHWMNDPSNISIISPNLKSTVYCTAIKHGGEEEWNFAWNQYLNSNVGSEKDKLLYAMGCSKETWMLSRYLELAFAKNSAIRTQDAARVFSSIARNNVGRYLAWNFLKEQWPRISKHFGSGLFAAARIVKFATGAFNTDLELKELELFRDKYKGTLKAATRAVDQNIERTSNNIAWMNNSYDTIVGWLENNGHSNKLRNL
ncbi:hypothetical protein SK128_002213 [Halocaridina rubra]|uniref:ERAP1-like C-terminal domain-containing protein n=1 Tax=Halocaridina rubra TaxID=373956 RepID=A0AAN8XKS7_HALRR